MIDTLVTKVKGFFLSPVETFRQSKNDSTESVFVYFGVLLLINAILSAIITAVGLAVLPSQFASLLGVALPVAVFVLILICGFVFTLVFAAWLHLWVSIFGGHNGIMQTINAVIYGGTPRLLLGWIPFIGIIFSLWSLVLTVLGIRELQDLSTTKAILVVFIAIIIPLIVIILIAAWFLVSFMSVTAMPESPTALMPAY